MTPEEKLKTLGIELPEIPKPLGSYVPFVRTGNLIFLSGMLIFIWKVLRNYQKILSIYYVNIDGPEIFANSQI